MTKYEVTLKIEIEANDLDELEDIVYEEVRELMEIDLLSACVVEEVWDRFEKPEQTPMRGYPA
jgi:hypothetical protein